jgi:hypothetical protein
MTINRVPTDTLWVCTDCMLMHCNGECGELPEGSPVPLCLLAGTDTTMGMLLEEHEEECPNRLAGREACREHECDCETRSFSWSSCEGCGSPLGGERHALTAWVAPQDA